MPRKYGLTTSLQTVDSKGNMQLIYFQFLFLSCLMLLCFIRCNSILLTLLDHIFSYWAHPYVFPLFLYILFDLFHVAEVNCL